MKCLSENKRCAKIRVVNVEVGKVQNRFKSPTCHYSRTVVITNVMLSKDSANEVG